MNYIHLLLLRPYVYKMFMKSTPGPSALKICRVTLQITLHFVTLEIQA